MQKAAYQFIRSVLAIHIALLLVVMLIVAGAARNIRNKALEQEITHAQVTQELIARQTARGVENYYHAITSVLELLTPSQEEEVPGSPTTRGAAFALMAPPGVAPLNNPNLSRAARNQELIGMRRRLIEALWRDVQQRVSLLFLLDSYEAAPHLGANAAATQATDPRMVIRDTFGGDDGTTPRQVVDSLNNWIRSVQQPQVSAYANIDGLRCNVVVVPIRNINSHRFLVAVVPINRIEKSLFSELNVRATGGGAIMVDDQGTIMSATRAAVGDNVKRDNKTPRLSSMAARYMQGTAGGTELFRNSETVNGRTLQPAMITVEPILLHELGDKRWSLGISSALSDEDEVVSRLLGAAVFWAIFVIVSVSAILLSTATQLIRSRLRMERLQHQMLEKELAQARDIQLNWLPHKPLHAGAIHVAAVNRPASRISGDFYNWFELPDGRIAIAIGDVTGHGMAAAFLMATTQMLVRSTMLRVGDPGKCLEEVNRQLCTQVFNGQFVTIFLVVIDTENLIIEAATAGHPPPLICDEGGLKKMPIEPQLVLGVESESTYPTQKFRLPPSAKLLLYTDGVTDAATAGGKRFTVDGLRKCLGARKSMDAKTMLDAINKSIDDFRGGYELSDDLTLVVIQLQPAAIAAASVGAEI
jgi:serine phosphatase RsbU (regulator of sigma subunit)